MDRRDFMKGVGLAGSLGSLPLAGAFGATQSGNTASRGAFQALLQTLAAAEKKYLSPAYGIERAADIADGERYMMHVLETALYHWFEADPDRPVFKKYVTPSRKLLGDNPDALYYFAPIRAGRSYRISGNLAGATFTSFTVEKDGIEGRKASGSIAAIDDTKMHIESDGSFELLVSPTKQGQNWLDCAAGASQLTTRHYFETQQSIGRDEAAAIPLTIEALDPLTELPRRTDADIADRIGWVANYVEAMTVDSPLGGENPDTPWVSRTPNQFNKPMKWAGGESGYGNTHAAYAMAPYLVMPDQALIIEGRFPPCKFANVVLWNRFLQAYDFRLRNVSLNRAQTVQGSDGEFRIVIAHRDPGVPNWLDASGRPYGLVYWRFLFPEGEIETPRTRVVTLSEVLSG
ncbi:MAG: DUF1214 domain-containing protein [Pseudomonadota bacterium]